LGFNPDLIATARGGKKIERIMRRMVVTVGSGAFKDMQEPGTAYACTRHPAFVYHYLMKTTPTTGTVIAFVFSISISVVTIGCSSTPIHQKYAENLATLQTGETTLGEFRSQFPEAYIAGQSGDVTAYVVETKEYAPYATGADYWSGNVTQRLHFYFKNEILERWGRPGDWESDFDITVRNR
jgi:hypothetical protein